MTTRHEAFSRYVPKRDNDPSPDELTPKERTQVEDSLQAGSKPPGRLIRKMLRQSDKQLAKIIELERIAFPLKETTGAPTWKPGDTVWYLPSANGPRFPAVVDSEPWQLGGHSWVVRLRDLPQAYCDYSKRQRTTVPAAECVLHVQKRDPEATR